MEMLPGVRVYLTAEDKPIGVGNEGHLLLQNILLPNTTLTMSIKALPQVGKIRTVFTIGDPRKKDIHPLPKNPTGLYQHSMRVQTDQHGTPYLPYPQNHVRLVELSPRGELTVWEIAVISQDGQFFRTNQPTYRVQCYRDDQTNDTGAVVCPTLGETWPQIIPHINKFLMGRANHLPPIEQYKPSVDLRDTNLLGLPGENVGLVLWYNHAMGLGALSTHNGIVRVRRPQISTARKFLAFLVPGEIVTYKSLRPTTGNTTFKMEATGVTM